MHSTLGVSGTGTRLDLIDWLAGASLDMFFFRHRHYSTVFVKNNMESGKHLRGLSEQSIHLPFFHALLRQGGPLYICVLFLFCFSFFSLPLLLPSLVNLRI